MMRNKIKIILLLVTISILSTGCYPTGEKKQNSDILNSSLPDSIENLTIDLKDKVITPNIVPEVKMSLMEWDSKKLQEIFLAKKTIIEEYKYASDMNSDELRCVYYTDDGYWVVYEPGRLTVENLQAIKKYGYRIMESMIDVYYTDKLFSNDDLVSFSKSDAITRVNEVLEELNITNLGEPNIYSVSVEEANSILADLDEFSSWTRQQEVYILEYPYKYENIDIVTSNIPIFGTDNYYDGASVSAIISQNEIISLRCNSVFSAQYTIEQNMEIKFDSTEALNEIISFYADQKIEDNIVIYDCKLVYVPIGLENWNEYIFVPVWQFRCYKENDWDIAPAKYNEYINSQNGIRYDSY